MMVLRERFSPSNAPGPMEKLPAGLARPLRSAQSGFHADPQAWFAVLPDVSFSLFVSLRDQTFDSHDSRADILGHAGHVDDVPVVAAVLETHPMAVAADFVRGHIQPEIDVPATVLCDLSRKGPVRGLIAADVGVALVRPAAFLPVGNLAALDDSSGAVPPRQPRKHLADGSGGRPGAEVPYAHHGSTPTSALVEAKIFFPSLTLSYTDSAAAKNGSFEPLDSK